MARVLRKGSDGGLRPTSASRSSASACATGAVGKRNEVAGGYRGSADPLAPLPDPLPPLRNAASASSFAAPVFDAPALPSAWRLIQGEERTTLTTTLTEGRGLLPRRGGMIVGVLASLAFASTVFALEPMLQLDDDATTGLYVLGALTLISWLPTQLKGGGTLPQRLRHEVVVRSDRVRFDGESYPRSSVDGVWVGNRRVWLLAHEKDVLLAEAPATHEGAARALAASFAERLDCPLLVLPPR